MSTSYRSPVVAIVAALALWGVSLAAQSMSKLPGELTMAQSGESPGTVQFRHEAHVDADRPSCTTCHPREFRILKANAAKRPAITHAEMEKGRYCGRCHDGKKAFAMDDCTSCHQ